MRKVHVLVIDDSLTIRAMVEQILADDPDLEIVGIADCAESARVLITTHRPDVVTLDVAMPGIGGMAFLDEIVAHWGTPVVMMSSSISPGTPAFEDAMERGAATCFEKALVSREGARLATLLKAAGRNVLKPKDRFGWRAHKHGHGSGGGPTAGEMDESVI